VRFTSGSSGLFTVPAPPLGPVTGGLSFDVVFAPAGLASSHTASLELVAAHGVVTRVNLGGSVDPPLPGTTDLRALLEWNTPWTDFDLHLLRDGGLLFTEEDDCYFATKNPDWGALGEPGDDPFLDRDDIDGFGPEEASIFRVGDTPALYHLFVQYHHYSRESAPLTAVKLTLQIREQPPLEIERDMSVCGNLWYVGRFRFGSAPAFEVVNTENNDYQHEAGERCD
jgi:uncharacterized protein YfaP (DUF2135 family)